MDDFFINISILALANCHPKSPAVLNMARFRMSSKLCSSNLSGKKSGIYLTFIIFLPSQVLLSLSSVSIMKKMMSIFFSSQDTHSSNSLLAFYEWLSRRSATFTRMVLMGQSHRLPPPPPLHMVLGVSTVS